MKDALAGIISHMNDHHGANLKDLCVKFAGAKNPQDARLVGVDLAGLDLVYREGEEAGAEKKLRVEFPAKTEEAGLKEAIIALCMGAKPASPDGFERVKKEIEDFVAGFNSLCLATLTPGGEVVCSYAPFIRSAWGDFIYISSVSEHFANIKAHPENIEAMFLEDEASAASPILRKRLRYRVRASLTPRGELFDKVFDEFEKKTGGGGGIKTIRGMLDFHLVKFDFGRGRFVKGFGQAYDLDGDRISQIGAQGGNPHGGGHGGGHFHGHGPHGHGGHPSGGHPHGHSGGHGSPHGHSHVHGGGHPHG